jgi:hypothetical protein
VWLFGGAEESHHLADDSLTTTASINSPVLADAALSRTKATSQARREDGSQESAKDTAESVVLKQIVLNTALKAYVRNIWK